MTERWARGEEIRELDAETRDRIAAGEVVERPASAVKELVENALDADASRVDVTVTEGGIGGIRVADDGVGMDRTAVERAIEEHTTSKIRDIADLEAGVRTLGFRGEALHAIAAVSRTTITTRPRPERDNGESADADDGTELVVEGGEVTAIRPAGRPPGTTVAVEDLFYNVPARRKYLKQPSTEFAHVNTVVARYALANPEVAVSLTHDDRDVFATTGRGDLQETILSVYGREVARSMIEVETAGGGADGEGDGDDAGDGFDLPDGPLDGIAGLVSHPETNRAGREYLATYVNGRAIRSATVREAIVEAYGTQLAPDRYPFAVLFLDVDPATVDVNVHPRKREVRFADDEGVRQQVEAAVEEALLREGLIRSGAPRGKSAPEQTEVTPTAADDSRDTASDDGGSTASASAGGDDRTSTPPTAATERADEAADAAGSPKHWSAGDDADSTASDAPSDDRTTRTRAHAHDRQRRFRGGDEQTRLDGERPDDEFQSLPSMRILGQFKETYVLAETDDGLVVIDQHAADERINYERLRDRFASNTTTQTLAEPVEVELTAREAAVFDDRSAGLAELGFRAERVDDRTVAVSAIPGLLAGDVGPELIRDLLAAYVEGEHSADDTIQSAADHLLGDLACYPSITANTSLAEGSIRDLLAALDDCENPYACPHGRPVIVSITTAELEDRFERDYPGHQGRRE